MPAMPSLSDFESFNATPDNKRAAAFDQQAQSSDGVVPDLSDKSRLRQSKRQRV